MYHFIFLSLLGVILLPLTTFAQDFVPLVGIPFVDTNKVNSLGQYANAFYIAAISLGAVIAVLKIIFAGVKYMLTDIVTDKSQAKADIKGALLGLVLIIGAVLLLNTINPDLTSLRAFDLDKLEITAPPPQGEIVNPDDGVRDVNETAEQCSVNLVRYVNGGICCPANAQCRPTDIVDNGSVSIPGYVPGTIYYKEELDALIAGNPNIVDLGPSTQGYTEATVRTECTRGSVANGRDVADVVIAEQRYRTSPTTIISRAFCIYE